MDRLGEKRVFYGSFVFAIFKDVYEPAEDSFLIAENLEVYNGEKVLDLGAGCGILSVLSTRTAKEVVAVDINPNAVMCTKHNAKINGVSSRVNVIRGNLFDPLRNNARFDLILFNSPYLPTENEKTTSWIDYAWDGGKNGRKIIDQFIYHVSHHLKPNGRLLLVQSTLSGLEETFRELIKRGFKVSILAEKKVEFETITLIKACQASNQ